MTDKSNYYLERADFHRMAARTAPSDKIRSLHIQMAESYDVLAAHRGRIPLQAVEN